MRDGAGSLLATIGSVALSCFIGLLGVVCCFSFVQLRRPALEQAWRAAQLVLRLMLAGKVSDKDRKPERIIFSSDEYPGTPPSPAAVREAECLRQEGNNAYAASRFEEAVALYSKAVLLNPCDHLVYSNRSACWLRMERPIEALDDAEFCVKLAPSFSKAYLRKGAAEQMLSRRVDAQESFRKGLDHEPENPALNHASRELKLEHSAGSVQATLYHVLFVSPHLQIDRLFQALEDPDSLTNAYVEKHKVELDAQFECLTATLVIDVGLLLASPVLRDAYDRVTFACGQLLQWAPEAVSRHLSQAPRIVEGLGLALRCGWRIHHGVAKFSANALTILATSEGAEDKLRRKAVRLLLGGLLRWLLDPTPEPEDPPEDRDVCGCTFLSSRLSAATWLERLFEHGTKPWVREECENFHDITLLVMHLCLVVRDERGVPLGLPCLLRLPGVAKGVMASEVVLDLSTCSHDDLAGKRDGRRWLPRQKSKSQPNSAQPGNASPAARPPAAPTGPGAVAEEASAAEATSPPAEDLPTLPAAALNAAAALAEDPNRLAAPSQRLGEWLMSSLGYLLVFIDDDALFAAHACSALRRLALSAPTTSGDGVARLTNGMWMGLPLLERLSMLACQHRAALELLELLARQSGPARAAICSLATALASRTTPKADTEKDAAPLEDAQESSSMSDALKSRADEAAAGAAGASPTVALGRSHQGLSVAPMELDGEEPSALSAGETALPLSDQDEDRPAEAGEDSRTTPAAARKEEAHDHEGSTLGEPSWVESYHELKDELWIDKAPTSLPRSTPWDVAADSSLSMGAHLEESDRATSSASRQAMPAAVPKLGVVTLGNFDAAAWQIPAAGRICISGCSHSSSSSSKPCWPKLLEASAVPAVWNSRFADSVDAKLKFTDTLDLGSKAWRIAKEGSVLVLLRSAIQKTPLTPDWASAVWLCADAGVSAAIVINDLVDNGAQRPAFRMGLFGSPPPPVPAFMISGPDGDALRDAVKDAASSNIQLHASVGGLRVSGDKDAKWSHTATDVDMDSLVQSAPRWPLIFRGPPDVAQAWSLFETVNRVTASAHLAGELSKLAAQMGLPEKRVWLTRRLQRYHRGDTDTDDPVEPPLAFAECERDGDLLLQLRKQFAEKTGLAAPDITAEFEVRFKDESSVGSAVMREWMDILAQKAFLKAEKRLLTSYDNGATFLPDPAAPFLNPNWRGDFQLLGRLVGLAFWHQVTLDLPLHPHLWKLLLLDGDMPAADFEKDMAEFQKLDPELHRHKVRWLMSADISELGFAMPFTDSLLGSSSSSGGTSGGSSSCTAKAPAGSHQLDGLRPLPEVVSPADVLEGHDEQDGSCFRLRRHGPTEVRLVADGEHRDVTEANKREFVEALLDWRLRGSLLGPVQEILLGLRAAVPSEVLAEARRMLNAEEVHFLLAGSRQICVEDWEENSRCAGGLKASSQEVRWFWKIVRQWAQEGRQGRLQDLLQFATGSRRVPVGGFAQLMGFNGGKHLFTLVRGVHLKPQSLPTSHACICTVDLPPWESFEAAERKLLAAAEVGKERFDEGTGRPADESN
eukprot:TRINITY_DN40481_c0_g1_i3.p1 TRINITY_DN40481_c0_g1~~TRINITY_DN40481_c0_g1_i3.p1  ORF type:complete len:1559 (-),score=419.77 TRINITY_DN40481_c0_g1_i3:124-4800(-)